MSLSEEWKKELNTNTSTSQKWKSEITGKAQTPQLPEYKVNLPGISNTAPTVQEMAKNLNMQEKSNLLQDTGRVANYGVASLADAVVDTAEFGKNAFKYQMFDDERKGAQAILDLQNKIDKLQAQYDAGVQNWKKKSQTKYEPTLILPDDVKQTREATQSGQLYTLEQIRKYQQMIDNIKKKYGITDAQETLNKVNEFAFKPNAIEQAVEDYSDYAGNELAKASKPAQVVGGAVGTVARMGPSIASNIALPGSGLAPMFMNASQQSFEEAVNNGANYDQAMQRGVLSGGLEIGTEMLSGGLSNTLSGIPGVANIRKYTQGIDNKWLKGLLNIGGEITGEGLEEVASAIIQPYIDRATYNPDAQNATMNDLWINFRDSILPTIIMQGGGIALQSQRVNQFYNKQISDINSSNLSNEQKAQAVNELNAQKKMALEQIITGEENQDKTQTPQNNIQNVSENQNIAPQNVQTPQNVVENVPKAIETPLTQPAQTMSNNVENTLNSNNDMYTLRDFKEVGNRKVNAYQYDNPAVKPYFQQAAREMLSDLRDSVKGERYMTQVDGETNFGGQPRITTADIASLLDGDNGVRLSYDDIEKGLKAIIEDHGAENNAKSKRIEFALDNRLRNGYTLADGMEIPANEEYLNYLQDSNQNDKYDSNYDISNTTLFRTIMDNLDSKEIDAEIRNLMVEKYGEDSLDMDWRDTITPDIEDKATEIVYNRFINSDKGKELIKTWNSNVEEQPQPSNIFEETNQMIENNRNQQLEESSKALALEKPTEEKKIKSLVDIANMTEEDIKQEKGVTYKHKADKNTPYQRKFFENMESSKIISDDVKDRVDMTSYERKANEATLERVNEKLDENGDKMIKEWERKTKNFTDEDVALGAILIQRYQQQGDIESAVDVVQKLADMGTEAGRAVQMFSIFQRLTPEAMMVYQQRKLDAVFDNIKQKKTGDWVDENKEKFKLTTEDAQFIQEQVEKAQNAETERQKQIELAKIEKRINDKLPPEAGQSIKALRRIAMLFNPKTQVRNIVGNTLIKPVNMVADFVGTQIDKAIARKTGVRTTNYTDLKSEAEGFKKGIKESIEDYKLGIRTEPTGSKYEFEIGGKPFNENTKSEAVNAVNRKLNGINDLLSAVMSGGDRPFYEAAFNNSLQGQMKANNVDVPTADMIDIATNEALQRTWNDNNSYTQAVLGIRSAMNKLNIKGFGLGDLIIPFAKTPANLTKAMVEYNPIGGLIESLIDYNDMRKAISRGEMTPQQQKKFVSSTSKAIAGTILYAIAGSLVKSGTITGSKDKDKDVANFEQNVLGIQPYSVKIGDKTFTYSWANPINFPLAVMADTYKMSKENAKLSEILYNGFKVAGDTLLDNSFLQGIKELFESDSIADGLVDAIADMPNQFVPTFMKQLADLADDTKRQSFEYNDLQQTSINKTKAKIPGLKNELAPQVNTFGEEIKNYGGDNNPFNIFFNPANISKSNATESQKALYDLYQETKDKTIFPRQAPYYVSNKGEKINLSSQDRAEYQKISGEYVTKELDALFDSEFYKTLTSDQKVDVVNKIVSDADTKGKDKWVDSESTEKLAKLEKDLDGIPMVDYYNAWIAQKGIESDKNYQGKTITNSKSKKQKAAVDKATPGLTQKQREILYDMFSIGKSVW